MKLSIAGAALAALLMAAPAAHANLVTNGGFETGDFTGWTLTNDNLCFGPCSLVSGGLFGSYVPHSGGYEALLGTPGGDGTLSQTISDTAGQRLVLTYWLASDGGQSNNFSASWDGRSIAASALTNIAASGYTEYKFVVFATGTDTLSFNERNDNGWLSLDDVRLNVPEPATLSMLGAGLVALVGLRRRRKSKTGAV